MNLTKADIIDTIAIGTGLTKLETEAVVDGFLKTVKDAMSEGRNIELRGFGSFKVKLRKPRIGRNPKTGERVDVEARYVPYFKVSKDFQKAVDEQLHKKNK